MPFCCSLMVNFPLLKKEVVVTEKLDGGNCSISGGKVYARTVNGEATHPSFGPIKQLASQVRLVTDCFDTLYSFVLHLYNLIAIYVHTLGKQNTNPTTSIIADKHYDEGKNRKISNYSNFQCATITILQFSC